MPPDAAATYMVAGSFGSTSMSCTRPPVAAGPMERKRNESKGDWAASVAAPSRATREERMVGMGEVDGEFADPGRIWLDAQWFVGCGIAASFSRVALANVGRAHYDHADASDLAPTRNAAPSDCSDAVV